MAREPPLLAGVDLGTSAVKVLALHARRARSWPRGRIVVSARNAAARLGRAGRERRLRGDDGDRARSSRSSLLARQRGRGDRLLERDARRAAASTREASRSGPLLTWMDRRSAGIAERWRADGTADRALRANRCARSIRCCRSCKLRWLSENEPERLRARGQVRSDERAARLSLDWRVADRSRNGFGVRGCSTRVRASGAIARSSWLASTARSSRGPPCPRRRCTRCARPSPRPSA